jgi:hypothetical protein
MMAITYMLQMLPFLALIPSYLWPSACFFLLQASQGMRHTRLASIHSPELSHKRNRVHATVLRKSRRYDLQTP